MKCKGCRVYRISPEGRDITIANTCSVKEAEALKARMGVEDRLRVFVALDICEERCPEYGRSV